MKKPFFVANVRDILDLHTSGEISFSMMVKLFNDVSFAWHEQNCKYEVSMVECDLCKNRWVAVRPEGTPKLECNQCGYVANFENIDTDE